MSKVSDEEIRESFKSSHPEVRKCKLCECEFTPLRNDAKFCCPSHRVMYSRERRKLQIEANAGVEPPRWFEVKRECEVCHSEYYPKAPTQKYCCQGCYKVSVKMRRE